jgi:hypothetical protein
MWRTRVRGRVQARRRDQLQEQHSERREAAFQRIDQPADENLKTATPQQREAIDKNRQEQWNQLEDTFAKESGKLEDTEERENEAHRLSMGKAYQSDTVKEASQSLGMSMSSENGGMEL